MQTDFAAHPFLGIIAQQVLEDYRFARAKPVTLACASDDDDETPPPAAGALPVPQAA